MSEPILMNFEPLSAELLKELLPLAQKCWDENTIIKAETCAFYGEREFQIEPDLEQYYILAKRGVLHILAFRAGGILQGYLSAVLFRSLHHKKFLTMMVDSAYIEPAFRSYTAVLIEKFERHAREQGTAIIGWPAHINGPLYQFLKASGYVGDDLIMEKKLCA